MECSAAEIEEIVMQSWITLEPLFWYMLLVGFALGVAAADLVKSSFFNVCDFITGRKQDIQ